jgi:hypothetical protein
MMSVDMIDLSCTGAHRAIMLEIAGNVTPSQRPMATLKLEISGHELLSTKSIFISKTMRLRE